MPLITLDKVVAAAIANSDKLKLESQQILMYRNKMTLQDKTNDFYKAIGQKVYDFPYDKLELMEKQTNQSKDFLQDQIESDITNKYNTIIMQQIELGKAKTNLEIKNKDLNTVQAEVNIGLATSNQLTDKQIEIKSLKDDIQAKADSLKNNMDYLSILTDLNLSEYILDQNISYNIFKIEGSEDEYLDDKINAYLKYNQKMIDLTKDYLKDTKDNGLENFDITAKGTATNSIKDIVNADIPSVPDKTSSSYYDIKDENGNASFNSGKYALDLIGYQQKVQNFMNASNAYSSYLDGKYNINEAQVKLDDSKRSLKNGLKVSYSTLLDLQNKIDTLNEQIKSTNTKLRYAKTQIDLGLMTKNDYDAMALKSKDLGTSLRQLINTYNNLKDSIQKPWELGTDR